MSPRLLPKTIVCPPESESTIESAGLTVSQIVERHVNGDWGAFCDGDGGSLIKNPVRDRAALLAMFDLKLRATDVCRLTHDNIDWNMRTATIESETQTHPAELDALLSKVTVTKRSNPTNRSSDLTATLAMALKEWLAKTEVHSGPLFPGLEPTYLRHLMKAIQASHSVANEIAILLDRGTVDSLFLLEAVPQQRTFFQRLFSPKPQNEGFAVAVRTCLDSSKTLVQAPVDGATMMALQVIASPTFMFGPNREPFRRTRFAVGP